MKVLWVHNYLHPNKGRFRNPILNSLQSLNCSIEQYELANSRNLFSLLKDILIINKISKKYDLVHAQFGSTTLLASLLSSKPLVVTLRGSDLLICKRLCWHLLYSLCASSITRLCILLRSPRVVVMSIDMKTKINGIDQDKISIIPDPIDTEGLNAVSLQQNSDGNMANIRHLTSDFKVIFGSLQKSSPIKRYYLAKEAVDLANYLSSRQITLKCIENVDRKEFLHALVESDCLILTSLYEGWPNIVKEAIYLGIPVVALSVSDLEIWSRHIEMLYVCKDKIEIAQTLSHLVCAKTFPPLQNNHVNLTSTINRDKYIWEDPNRCASLLLEVYKRSTT